LSKHVAVLIVFMNCISLVVYVGGCIDCNNTHSTNNVQLAMFTAICNFTLTNYRKIYNMTMEFRCKTQVRLVAVTCQIFSTSYLRKNFKTINLHDKFVRRLSSTYSYKKLFRLMKRNYSSQRIRLADTIGETWGWGVFKGESQMHLQDFLDLRFF